MNRRNKMALLVAAIFLAGSPGINAADPVKFIGFHVAKVSPAGCKVMVTVEMLLNDMGETWLGNFMYQPPSGVIKTDRLMVGKVETECAAVMSAEKCEGYTGYVKFSTVDKDGDPSPIRLYGMAHGRLYFLLKQPHLQSTTQDYDVPNCHQPIAEIQPRELQRFRANPDPSETEGAVRRED
jgi:hypothetical protein